MIEGTDEMKWEFIPDTFIINFSFNQFIDKRQPSRHLVAALALINRDAEEVLKNLAFPLVLYTSYKYNNSSPQSRAPHVNNLILLSIY